MKLVTVAPAMLATRYGSSFLEYVRSFYGSREASAPALCMSERTSYRDLKACGLAGA